MIRKPRQPITNEELANSLDWCLAGDFAACPAMARDQDVWILGADRPGLERDGILEILKSSGAEYSEEENCLATQAGVDLYDMGDGASYVWKVARIADGRHIMLTTATDAAGLIARFDVSTHQVALTSDGELIKGADWTPLTAPPVALRHGVMTEARMAKIARRYQMLRSH